MGDQTVVIHKSQDVMYTALSHPWKYHYYIDCKQSVSCADKRLHNFLVSMFSSCPHDKFLKGPRSSSLKFDVGVDLLSVPHHAVCSFAQFGLDWGMQGTAHGNVQLFMLQNDKDTVGVEVPIWLDEHEYSKLGFSFDEVGSLSGHIDVLRIEDGCVWIWDFKPKAHKEKHADTQVFTYAVMLSFRTGIPLSQFRCGYFDQHNCYVFNPNDSPLAKKFTL